MLEVYVHKLKIVRVRMFGLHVLERYSVDRVARRQQTIAFSFVMDRGPTEREREGAREPTAPFVIMNWSQFDAAAALARESSRRLAQ